MCLGLSIKCRDNIRTRYFPEQETLPAWINSNGFERNFTIKINSFCSTFNWWHNISCRLTFLKVECVISVYKVKQAITWVNYSKCMYVNKLLISQFMFILAINVCMLHAQNKTMLSHVMLCMYMYLTNCHI